ncbi:hemolysin secretion protein D [Skermanella aerolata]|uniref:Hemolysin secretion protein D n=1 Tax=Skermanella aerolata TaxID=393310 RepID=A0A512DKK5_9PROT|nr:efflux RND transporter periplasmic adaptor subunit [Skermanella aerolata]KJB96840.1 RND transporter MFP subunit [Skermanella aerolata KACC 11604]GEO37013.1 hemolysin secretion protein D [Skermanella aerolata]
MLRTQDRFSFFGKLLLCAALLGVPATAPRPAHAADSAPVATPKPPSVSVATAASGTLAETILLTGTLVARDEVMVGAEIDGLAITELLAEEGDHVERGQVLARLSRDMLDAQFAQNAASLSRALAAIAQARNQIVEAEANSRQADAAYARSQALNERGNTTAENLEQREAASQVARARVLVAQDALRLAEADRALAEAQKREIQVRLARTEIKAPAAGIISRREARLGALVSSAADPLFRIIGGGTIEVQADVPETSLARLRPGQTALVRPAGMEEPVPAKVRLVSPEVNRTSRLGSVRLTVTPVPGLAIGAFARGTVEVDRRDGTLVPLSSVLYRPEGSIVQVVRDGVVETRSVTVGLKADGKAEIRQGIEPGEQVIAISGTFVRDGDKVTPVPLAAIPLSAIPGQPVVQTSSNP